AQEVGQIPVSPLGRYPGVRLVFSPDGKLLAAGHRLGAEALPVVVCDVATRQELWRRGGGPGGTWDPLAFTPDGKGLAAGQPRGTAVSALDARTGERRHLLRLPPPGPAVVLSCDGRTVAAGAGGERGIRFWDFATGKGRAPDGCPVGERPHAFSPDGQV